MDLYVDDRVGVHEHSSYRVYWMIHDSKRNSYFSGYSKLNPLVFGVYHAMLIGEQSKANKINIFLRKHKISFVDNEDLINEKIAELKESNIKVNLIPNLV